MQKLCLLMVCSALSGCVTLQADSLSGGASSSVARISGDYRIRAGAPVSVYLRSVDGQSLTFWQNAADVGVGSHRLLVDCAVATTKELSRHELNVAVDVGAHYSLRAEATSQQGCTRVYLERTK